VQSAKRKCLALYFYFVDADFGLIHVRLQRWFPMEIQVYLNGHEWLARKLTANGIGYTKLDNAFTWIEDIERAQTFSKLIGSIRRFFSTRSSTRGSPLHLQRPKIAFRQPWPACVRP
jgi:hypothetical protein